MTKRERQRELRKRLEEEANNNINNINNNNNNNNNNKNNNHSTHRTHSTHSTHSRNGLGLEVGGGTSMSPLQFSSSDKTRTSALGNNDTFQEEMLCLIMKTPNKGQMNTAQKA
jgi:hypothetical protein